MLYKVLNWVNEVYGISVFFLYIGLFFLTFMTVFVMPPAALLILIFSILFLVPFVMLGRLIKFATERLAPEGVRNAAMAVDTQRSFPPRFQD